MSVRMAMQAERFRAAVEEHQRMVFSIALRVTGEYSVAEEVAQDTFLALYRTADKLDGENHMRFWLRRVTVHRATDALRSRVRRPEAMAEEWMEETRAEADGSESSRTDVGIAARLDELLASLPEQMRAAIVLRYQEDMLPAEIAAVLEQPLATVKSNLQRGLQLMRRKAAATMKEYIRA